MDIRQHLLQPRSDHARAQRRRQPARVDNPATCSTLRRIAMNSLNVAGGQVYTLSGQIKTEDFCSARRLAPARCSMLFGFARSPITTAPLDWTTTTLQHVTVPAGTTPSVRLQTYGPVDTGSAWFANMSLQQEIPPGLQTFLLYPNYRGLMFSDQSQVASLDLTVTPPAGTSLASSSGRNRRGRRGRQHGRQPDLHSHHDRVHRHPRHERLPLGTYQLAGKLEDTSGNVLMTQSAYTIVKLDASARAGMNAWIDPANLAHFIDGNPHFVLGIYDTTDFSRQPGVLREGACRNGAGADQHDHQLLHHRCADTGDCRIHHCDEAIRDNVFAGRERLLYGHSDFPVGLAKEFGTDDPDTLITDYASALSSDPRRGRILRSGRACAHRAAGRPSTNIR